MTGRSVAGQLFSSGCLGGGGGGGTGGGGVFNGGGGVSSVGGGANTGLDDVCSVFARLAAFRFQDQVRMRVVVEPMVFDPSPCEAHV